MKQPTKQQNTTTTTVKNPNWPEANQLAIYKCSWEVEPGTTRNKFNEWSERVLNPGSPDLKASALTTGPRCLKMQYLQTWRWSVVPNESSRDFGPCDRFWTQLALRCFLLPTSPSGYGLHTYGNAPPTQLSKINEILRQSEDIKKILNLLQVD